jgi:hypothetical protein
VSGNRCEHSAQGSGRVCEAGAVNGKTHGIGALTSRAHSPLLASEKVGIALALF